MKEEPLIATVDLIQGYRVESYHGLVTTSVSCGINFVRGWLVALRDIFGGQVGTYQKEAERLKEMAIERLMKKVEEIEGANAIIGLRLDYHYIGAGKRSTLVLSATGTLCTIEPEEIR